ncbi:TBC1D7 family protein [Megaselia abdita]
MTTDERNFRSTYYEKVGCRSVEEKKSLKILLKENPINKSKLKQFCLSYSVPVEQRIFLWSIILDITPLYPTNNEFVLQQRSETYSDLLRALQTMRYIDSSTPKHKVIFLMWALENKVLMEVPFSDENCLTKIIKILLEMFDDDYVMIFWISREFFKFSQEIHLDYEKHLYLFKCLLEKEDSQLFNHFNCFKLFEDLPLDNWCSNCFAGVLSGPAIVRFWDKICGGSRKIVAFVLLMLFKTLKKSVLEMTTAEEIIALVEKGSHQNDLIVNKAIESWHNSKSHGEIVDN